MAPKAFLLPALFIPFQNESNYTEPSLSVNDEVSFPESCESFAPSEIPIVANTENSKSPSPVLRS